MRGVARNHSPESAAPLVFKTFYFSSFMAHQGHNSIGLNPELNVAIGTVVNVGSGRCN